MGSKRESKFSIAREREVVDTNVYIVSMWSDETGYTDTIIDTSQVFEGME